MLLLKKHNSFVYFIYLIIDLSTRRNIKQTLRSFYIQSLYIRSFYVRSQFHIRDIEGFRFRDGGGGPEAEYLANRLQSTVYTDWNQSYCTEKEDCAREYGWWIFNNTVPSQSLQRCEYRTGNWFDCYTVGANRSLGWGRERGQQRKGPWKFL